MCCVKLHSRNTHVCVYKSLVGGRSFAEFAESMELNFLCWYACVFLRHSHDITWGMHSGIICSCDGYVLQFYMTLRNSDEINIHHGAFKQIITKIYSPLLNTILCKINKSPLFKIKCSSWMMDGQ